MVEIEKMHQRIKVLKNKKVRGESTTKAGYQIKPGPPL